VAESGDPLLASFREITPSIQGDKLVAAASGLSAGDRVVVAGQSKLEDGVKVSIHSDLSDTYYGEMN
jgi:multidrug efflux pump subunit AcrA (membrane-fusion protein)